MQFTQFDNGKLSNRQCIGYRSGAEGYIKIVAKEHPEVVVMEPKLLEVAKIKEVNVIDAAKLDSKVKTEFEGETDVIIVKGKANGFTQTQDNPPKIQA